MNTIVDEPLIKPKRGRRSKKEILASLEKEKATTTPINETMDRQIYM